MTYDSNNVFAKILRKEIPSSYIYEDDHVVSFNDISPLAPVHVLVIPKGEYINFDHFHKEAPQEVILGFYKAICTVTQQLGLEDGYRLVSNKGDMGGQQVPHYHVHILSGTPMGSKLMVPKT